MAHRRKPATRNTARRVSQGAAGKDAASGLSHLTNIAELIEDGEITVGAFYPVGCVATATDGHNSLAMLVRRKRETLPQLLIRLDAAIAKARHEDIVSNHGGRNFDTVPATIDALPLVAEKVAGRIPILMDGGVRRGTDVLKALALGAATAQIGRPYVYGLGAAGADGVARVLRILQNEFMMAMALAGRPRIADIDCSVLWLS